MSSPPTTALPSTWFGTLYRITLPKLSLGFGTMLIAHITFNIPYVILSVGPKLRQMDRNLVDAAQDLGCTWMQAFFKVILPEIKPGIISGALIAFTMSVDDFVISYFTAGSSVSTLAIEIYGMARTADLPGDQRRLHPAVRGGDGAAGGQQHPGGSGGPSPGRSGRLLRSFGPKGPEIIIIQTCIGGMIN